MAESPASTSSESAYKDFCDASRRARLLLANELFRTYHSRCFWHSPHDLAITEELIPFVIRGLRTHGGRRGFILAEKLRTGSPDREPPTGNPSSCR